MKYSEKDIFARNPEGSLEKLQKVTVGIAGAGGLGSNIAVSLVRAGIRKMIIADFDRIEPSNLNRQQFYMDQIGQKKVEALKTNLLKINPNIQIDSCDKKINKDNVCSIFGAADMLAEAFDRPEMNAMLANSWLQNFPDKFFIAGSGLSGYGEFNELRVQTRGKMIVCGDQTCENTPEIGLTAARVALVANMQANAIIELILDGKAT